MLAEYQQHPAVPSLWRVRLGLAARSLRQSWSMFLSTRIGVGWTGDHHLLPAAGRSSPDPDEHGLGAEDLRTRS